MFRTNILTKFLLRRFFSGVGLVMLVVCGIILAVTFVERLPSNPTAMAALYDSWVRLLEYVPMFLPLAVFMGTLFTAYNLTKSSESIIVSRRLILEDLNKKTGGEHFGDLYLRGFFARRN